jgi:sugar lactone lactonase YvrE
MKFILLLFLLLFSFAFSISAQTVSTVVPGPSTFNDGLDIDLEGNIYASDYFGTTVTKITPGGSTSIFASGFSNPNGLKFGPDGFLYVPSVGANKISKVSLNGAVFDYLTINNPAELYFDSDGLLYVANYTNSTISTVDTAKNINVLFSGPPLNGPIGVLKDSTGTLYIGNFTDGKVFRIDNGTDFVEIGDLPSWLGFMILVGENIYATAYQTHRIYKIPIDGSGQSIFAGTGSAGNTDGNVLSAQFNNPNGITATSTGDTFYVSEYTPRRLRMITGVLNPTSVSDDEIIISDFELLQNYPNPFNPATTINYSVPYKSSLKIKLYDVLGNEVATLLDEEISAGNYSLSFNASDLSSGVYFYQLKAYPAGGGVGTFTQTKKMILLR